jgi:hypothetical protein
MIFFDVFGNRTEKFTDNNPKQESKQEILEENIQNSGLSTEDILKNLSTKYSDGYIVKPVINNLSDEEFLGLAGNISTTGIIKAKEFVKMDNSPINEISVYLIICV